MSVRRLVLMAGAIILVGTGAVVLVLRTRGGTPASTGAAARLAAASDPGLAAALVDQGFPAEFVELFASARTELVSSDGDQHRFRQVLPDLSIVRTVAITVQPVGQIPPGVRSGIPTSRGFDIYPLSAEVARIPSGSATRTRAFVPFDSMPQDLTDAFRKAPAASARHSDVTHPISFAATQASAMIGVVVESVVATAPTGDSTAPLDPAASARADAEIQAYRALDQEVLTAEWDPTDSFQQPATPELVAQRRAAYEAIREEAEALNRAIERAREIARLGKSLHTAGVIAHLGFGGLELFHSISDWINADDELDALEDCAKNPTAPLARKALTDDPNNARATTEHIADTRTQVAVTNGARLANTGANTAAGFAPGVGLAFGAALAVASASGDAQLADIQRDLMADVRKSVVPCKPQYISATVAFRRSIWKTHAEAAPVNRISNSVSEVLNGTVVLALENSTVIPQVGDWGDYRWTDVHNFACATLTSTVTGAAAMYFTGRVVGFRNEEIAPGRTRPVGLFDLHLSAEGADLALSQQGSGFHSGTGARAGQDYCEPSDSVSENTGTMSVVCNWEEIPLIEGGSFFSPDGYKDDGADPDDVDSASCRVDLRFLGAPPPRDPSKPSPPRRNP